jgi:putative nucleotidyltransferase with HDIG domain
MPPGARVFASATTVAGLAVLAVAAPRSIGLPLQMVALLGIAVLVAELMQVASDGSHAGEPTHFSFSAGVHIAAVVAFGPWGAALVAALGVGFVDRLRGVPLRQIGFNAGAFALSTVAAGQVYVLAGGHPGSIELPGDLPLLALLAAVAYAGNVLLISMLVGLASGRRPVALAVETARGQSLAALSEAGFGVALAYFVVYEPWAAITLGPLLIGAYKAHARLAQHGRETAQALETFARIVDERDEFTADHSERVAELVEGLARWVGLPAREVARLRWAGRLHDLGKVIVDSSVLHKPGKLDEREWAIVRRHPRISARILRRFELAHDEALAVEHHHERYDGRGYYNAAQSPLAAHMLTVADSFDAMTSDRPYRAGMPEESALAEIERASRTQFHPLVAKAFVAYVRGLPVETTLTPDERQALHDLWSLGSQGRRRLGRVRPTLQATGVGFAVAGLALLLVREFAAAAVTLGLAAASLVWSERLTSHRRRIASAIRCSLELPVEDERAEALLAYLSSHAGLRWAGLVAGGSLDIGVLRREWLGEGPPTEVLVNWLVRESGAGELVLADGAELGIDGSLACLPLGDRHSPRSYLVLLFTAAPKPAMKAALQDSAAVLARALGRLADEEPPARLKAVS